MEKWPNDHTTQGIALATAMSSIWVREQVEHAFTNQFPLLQFLPAARKWTHMLHVAVASAMPWYNKSFVHNHLYYPYNSYSDDNSDNCIWSITYETCEDVWSYIIDYIYDHSPSETASFTSGPHQVRDPLNFKTNFLANI